MKSCITEGKKRSKSSRMKTMGRQPEQKKILRKLNKLRSQVISEVSIFGR